MKIRPHAAASNIFANITSVASHHSHVRAQHCCAPACPGVRIISVCFFFRLLNQLMRDRFGYGVRCAAQPPPGARCTFNLVDLFTVDFFIL
jgi:hypothetical protein